MDFSSTEQQEKLQSHLNIHLKKDEQKLPLDDQIDQLHKRERKKWILMAVNIAAILFFGYSFYYHITQLSTWVFYILLAVFGLNVGLIFYQRNQIQELISYLKWKKNNTVA